MEKLLSLIPSISLFFFIFFLALFPSPNHATFSRSISREELGLKADNTLTHLTFYFHDIVSGPNPTVVQIANASITAQSRSAFGSLAMLDDPLTEGPESTSKLVGRAQGMYGGADLNVTALIMAMNFVFTGGEHTGSTLSVLGRNEVLESVREMAVVGGTGDFRFAKGYAQAKTHTFDQRTGDAVVKYDVYVSHAESASGSSGSGSSSGSSGSNGAPLLSGGFLFTAMVSIMVMLVVCA